LADHGRIGRGFVDLPFVALCRGEMLIEICKSLVHSIDPHAIMTAVTSKWRFVSKVHLAQ